MSSKSKQKNKPSTVMGQPHSVVHQQVHWNYPIPPPEHFEKLKQIDPRITDQFLDEWKKEAEHRRICEAEVLRQRDQEIRTQEMDVKAANFYDILKVDKITEKQL
jgi:hypothetical protein